jgi:uncharacterized MAPEG superfamily protein
MPLAYWCILIAALLPLPLVAYAKSESRDNDAPRDNARNLNGARRRAYAAHENAYENFPFFAAAVIVAVTQGAPISILDPLTVLYIVLRIAHAGCYIADRASLRSLAWLGGLIVNIAIFVLPTFK